jgi:hypothetical protein
MDAPYRLETHRDLDYRIVHAVVRSGVGPICEIYNFDYARRIVDGLNRDHQERTQACRGS